MALEGGATISSSAGESLFSTDGDIIWDREDHMMPNGSDIGGRCAGFVGSTSQSALIVPHPGNANLYYVFTTDCDEDNFVDGLRYSIVDLSLRQGLGDVILKNQLLVSHTAEKVAGILHPNGHDVWVVTHEVGTNRFFAYTITDAGLNITPTISATGQVHAGGRGYLKFSPDGKRLAAGSFLSNVEQGIDTELFKFNGNSGFVQADFRLTGDVAYSLSFSPDSKRLYTSGAWATFDNANSITQYNLEAGSPQQIIARRYVVPNSNSKGALQLGPDGRLYYMHYVQPDPQKQPLDYLGVFTDPNKIGAASGHVHESIPLPCWIQGAWGLPNFIESYFQTPFTGASDCAPVVSTLVESVDFIAHTTCSDREVVFENITSPYKENSTSELNSYNVGWLWDFGDGSSPLLIGGPPGQVTYTYSQPGTYNVKMRFQQFACPVATAEKVISIGDAQTVIGIEQDCQSLDVAFSADLIPNSPVTRWLWHFGDDNSSAEQNPVHRYSQPGDYTVTLSAESPSCGTLTHSFPTHIHGTLHLETSFIELCAGDTLMLRVPGDIPGDVQWNFGSTERSVGLSEAGEYWVQINQDDCTTADTITVALLDCVACPFSAPNVITPNDDDKNDTFVFQAECTFLSYRMNLYDRWGHRIHTTTSPEWDGRIHNEVPATGVYYYTIEFTHMGPRYKTLTRNVKGWLQILH